MAAEKPTVLILEAGSKAALPLIESSHAHGRRVIAGASRRYCCGFYSRAVRERVLYPSPTHEPEAHIEFLLKYLSHRHVDVLFPTGDIPTDIIARHQDMLRRYTHLALPAYEVFQYGRDKIHTLQAAKRAGVPIPLTWYPHKQPLGQIAKDARYPCLIKPALSAGARGITFVRSGEELMKSIKNVQKNYGRCLVQEFVPQTGMQHKADVVLGEDGELLAGVVYEKLRYYPPTGGSSVFNKTVHRPDILDLALRTLHEIKWRGFCDFDFITDPRNGATKLIEINPRYPESFRATYTAGVDMVELIYQLAHGRRPEPQLEYKADRYLRFLPGDLMWFLTSPDRLNQLRSFLTFWSPDVVYQVLSQRDPGPIMGYLLENLFIFLNPEERASRFRLKQARRKRT